MFSTENVVYLQMKINKFNNKRLLSIPLHPEEWSSLERFSMKEEKYKRAVEIKGKICSLKENLKDLKGGFWDKMRIELKTGYSDMGMDITRSTVFDEEIGYKVRDFINDTINNKIAELENEFENL